MVGHRHPNHLGCSLSPNAQVKIYTMTRKKIFLWCQTDLRVGSRDNDGWGRLRRCQPTPWLPLTPNILSSLLLALQQSFSIHTVLVSIYLGINIFTHTLLASFLQFRSSQLLRKSLRAEPSPPTRRADSGYPLDSGAALLTRVPNNNC